MQGRTDIDLGELAKQVGRGIAPVESSESFFARMVDERRRKSLSEWEAKINSLNDKASRLRSRKQEIGSKLVETRERHSGLREEEASFDEIRTELSAVIETLNASVSQLCETHRELRNRAARAQSAEIDLRRQIESISRNMAGDESASVRRTLTSLLSALRSGQGRAEPSLRGVSRM